MTRRTDLLVAADPSSQSGKAEKARQYGIPIVATAAMSGARAGDRVAVSVLGVERLVAHLCSRCGATWAAPARTARRAELCEDCRAPSTSRRLPPPQAEGPSSSDGSDAPVQSEALVCAECGAHWERAVARGRKPKICPDCRG